jgi:uncharacterized protein YutE (UPF0331/DUF86 family)
MMPGPVSQRVILDRLEWVARMTAEIATLPLDDKAAFLGNDRHGYVAESCLRRALEALLDIGRHILAKLGAQSAVEYKEIATKMGQMGVLSADDVARLRLTAGYRNRLVHFYHEVTPDELFEICSRQLSDVEAVADGFRTWLRTNSELVDDSL